MARLAEGDWRDARPGRENPHCRVRRWADGQPQSTPCPWQ